MRKFVMAEITSKLEEDWADDLHLHIIDEDEARETLSLHEEVADGLDSEAG